MGTLLSLDDPVGRLGRALAAAGHPAGHDRAAAALSAEIAHYRANMHRGATREGLEDLRAECAGVLAAALPEPRPSPALARELLHEALAFRLFPDAIPALRAFAAAGVPVAVVSDWDVSLPDTLGRLGVGDLVQAVVTSAEVGARKPDPRPFRAALAALGRRGPEVVHCGDDPRLDCAGARAAGMTGVTIARGRDVAPGPCLEVPDLRRLGDLVLG
jgi:FMN phosphatase YigB (HAD superfamily)